MFAVIFEVEPKPERRGDYLGLAASLKPALEKINGFIDVERFAATGDNRRVLSLSFWRDEKAVVRWRTLHIHHVAQEKGRSGIFDNYHLRVGEVTADSELSGVLPAHRFDETETGAAKVMTITEIRPLSDTSVGDPFSALDLPEATPGLIDRVSFDSIYNPGKSLVLGAWRDAAAALLWRPQCPLGAETRHRHVRVIRDYGMYDRREAPQYYPPAGSGRHT